MKISLEWLSQYLPGALDAQQAGEALTHGGLPVEIFEQHGSDWVIDVEVTSNRGDCLSHVGIARELSALLDQPWKPVEPSAVESATSTSLLTNVSIEAPQLCPHYTARVIRNVKIGPSPAWMTRRLEAVGLRSINNVVDVTNYVMFEMGQPLHAFDFDRLQEKRIIVRQARGGEKLLSIDGKERNLASDMLVIADAQRPVALAGVMGGLESEVSASTTNILLESARFDPLSVRKTSRTLALMSDSSYRFERQIDPLLPEKASLRAAQLILETAGGELLAGIVSAGLPGHTPKHLALRLSRLRQVLGVEFPLADVHKALLRLDLSPKLRPRHAAQVAHVPHAGSELAEPAESSQPIDLPGAAEIHVTIPSHRLDLNLEVDLIEEVARVLGYQRIPLRDEIAIRLVPASPKAAAMERIRSILVGAGYFEALSVSFVSDLLAGDFAPAEAAALLRTTNVKWRADARLRPSILPGLLEAIRRNENAGTSGARLFEIGSTFWADAMGQPQERRRLALAGGSEWRDLRGVIELLLVRLDAARSVFVLPDRRPGYASGACGRIEWGGEAIGHVGRTDRAVAEKLSLRELPMIAELELEALVIGTQHVPQLRPLPKFPAVRRDISLVVAESVPYQKIESLIRSLKLVDLEELEYVTAYRGKPLEKGTKSVTITLVFRSPTTTLKSEEVETSVQKAVEAAKTQLGATLRV